MRARKLAVCSIAASMAAIVACSKKDPQRQPSVPVSITTVKRVTVPYLVTANGIAEPMQTVAIEAQVNGILNRVNFSEGQAVQAGQVLFQIDPRPYVAVLDQARGQLARDEATAANARRDAKILWREVRPFGHARSISSISLSSSSPRVAGEFAERARFIIRLSK